MKVGKKGLEINFIVILIVLIILLVIAVGGYVILKGKGFGAIEFIKNLFRIRGG